MRMIMAKKEFIYQDGDFVVYPTHGVGKIVGTETNDIAGMQITLLVIRFEPALEGSSTVNSRS